MIEERQDGRPSTLGRWLKPMLCPFRLQVDYGSVALWSRLDPEITPIDPSRFNKEKMDYMPSDFKDGKTAFKNQHGIQK